MRKTGQFLFKLVSPKSENEDLRRREFILNVLLLGSVVISCIAVILVLYESIKLGSDFRGASPLNVIIAFGFFLTLYFLSRKGLFVLSSYILIGIYFVLATYILYVWGFELTPGLLIYVLVIVMSGVIVSTRFAFAITFAISIILFILSYFQINGITQPELYWKSEMAKTGDVIIFISIFSVIMIVSWLSNREIEKSLKRARKSEADLQEERDHLEVKIEERTSELKKTQMEKTMNLYKFAEFGRMTSGLFHDLVNPLTAVYLNLENLKKKGDGKVSSRIDSALKNIERVKDIITAGRAQIQKQEINTTFSIEDEITRALQMLSFKAKKSNVVFDVIPYSTAEMYGSSLKFYRLIICLISNAIDAYKGVTCDKNNRKIVIAFCQRDCLIRILIQDWGCGIKEQHKEKIFDPFFTTKNAEEGTGIGLSICKEIIEKDFNGSITVKSEEGKGATFAIDFPVKKGS